MHFVDKEDIGQLYLLVLQLSDDLDAGKYRQANRTSNALMEQVLKIKTTLLYKVDTIDIHV